MNSQRPGYWGVAFLVLVIISMALGILIVMSLAWVFLSVVGGFLF